VASNLGLLSAVIGVSICLFTYAHATHTPVVQSCSASQVSLQVLGSGGPELDDGRASSSYLIWQQGKARVLVDVGPGSSVNFGLAKGNFADLQAILLSHLHVDHSADLPAFAKGAYFSSRQDDLTVFGPAANHLMPATSDYVNNLIGNKGAFAYLSDYLVPNTQAAFKILPKNVPLEKNKLSTFQVSESITAKSIVVHHGPVAAIAWKVEVGNCSLSFSGDMSNQYQSLADLAEGSDLLIMHNAIPENARGVARVLHMPPSEIGKIAKQTKAKKVLLSHFMQRTNKRQKETLAEIAKHYSGDVLLANDLTTVELK
jgi:ribonuclease BN (tRNA processing enzyme)